MLHLCNSAYIASPNCSNSSRLIIATSIVKCLHVSHFFFAIQPLLHKRKKNRHRLAFQTLPKLLGLGFVYHDDLNVAFIYTGAYNIAKLQQQPEQPPYYCKMLMFLLYICSSAMHSYTMARNILNVACFALIAAFLLWCMDASIKTETE